MVKMAMFWYLIICVMVVEAALISALKKLLKKSIKKKEIAKAYSRGEPIVQAYPEYKKDFKVLFNKIKLNL